MILDLHCETFDGWIRTGALRHGPALHHAIELEAEVEVKMRRCVLLDDEPQRTRRRGRPVTRRLRGLREIPLLSVFGELLAGARGTPDTRRHGTRLRCLALARARLWLGSRRPLARCLLRRALLETGAQPRHEIEHAGIRLVGFRLLELDLFPLHLRLDDLHQVRAIVVRVLTRIERLSEVLDELL